MKLLVAVDVLFYNIGDGYNEKKEFMIDTDTEDFKSENDLYEHIRGTVWKRIRQMHSGEHFCFVILNIMNLREFMK